MPADIRFSMVGLLGSAEELRAEVREFLSCEITAGVFSPRCDAWLGEYSPEFSRKLGERGWLGMTWPKRYGGHERSALERFVVTEELLAPARSRRPCSPAWQLLAEPLRHPLSDPDEGVEVDPRLVPHAAQEVNDVHRGMFPVARGAKGLQAVRRKLWAEVLARVPVCVIVRPGDERKTSAGDRKE